MIAWAVYVNRKKVTRSCVVAAQLPAIATALVILVSIHGCVSGTALAHLPAIKNDLQLENAGHNGCLPGENEISNSTVNVSGVGTWNATCRGRVYLCAAVSSGNQAYEYSCAPAAQ
jgi:hypothetical protein